MKKRLTMPVEIAATMKDSFTMAVGHCHDGGASTATMAVPPPPRWRYLHRHDGGTSRHAYGARVPVAVQNPQSRLNVLRLVAVDVQLTAMP